MSAQPDPRTRGYSQLLEELKERVRLARFRAAAGVNRSLITLYWDIGRAIVARQRRFGWGSSIVDRLGLDLRKEFPGLRGFSPRNMRYARAFYLAYAEEENDCISSRISNSAMTIAELPPLETLSALPWSLNITLLERVRDRSQRLWYAGMAARAGWSQVVLAHQIEAGLFHRQGKALTNFDKTLDPARSDLAREMLKDSYLFSFLPEEAGLKERELERALVDHVQKFLLELGAGFAFVGRQVRLEVGGEEFYLDLLFYHLRLRCFVVIELKTGSFRPEHAGKMNFYLGVVDDQFRHPDDQPSVGLILCKSQNRLVAEYALRDAAKPIGVSAYRLTRSLPRGLRGGLPSIEQLEDGLK